LSVSLASDPFKRQYRDVAVTPASSWAHVAPLVASRPPTVLM
jgi:hypothetical protein